ncbi:UPF0262 family protein [Lichenibacterium dinghuense]|uniref:UPF0262 family protein n=1 Tax=Lichenibacterium dinghuense TaxID=2895977 RepID=UPI001F48BD17|nr:UPF0262 family protein [Lichenibacterium sp. 6Y81]
MAGDRDRLIAVTLDEGSIGRGNPDQEHERRIAIYDLVEENSFGLSGHDNGPYRLAIGLQEGKLVLAVSDAAGAPLMSHLLSLQPFRSVLRDYLMLCDTYYRAIRTASPSQIEAIDMGRRGLHNEGAALLGERLRGKLDADADTLRRLFTLMTALHYKG